MKYRIICLNSCLLAIIMLLVGCGDDKSSKMVYDPVAFHSGDECHVCGMIIKGFPGSKGEAVDKQGARKFCSTAEMFSWWLQPENQKHPVSLYVHDMARGTWESPDDDALINATLALYVINSNLRGAMGAALASFAQQEDAEAFAAKHGGRIVRFEEITLELLQPSQHGRPQKQQTENTKHEMGH